MLLASSPMSSLANQGYLQDKQTGDKPPAYPNQTYHPSSQWRHAVVIRRAHTIFIQTRPITPVNINLSPSLKSSM